MAVSVEIGPSAAEGVAVQSKLQPWLPLLLAASANSYEERFLAHGPFLATGSAGGWRPSWCPR